MIEEVVPPLTSRGLVTPPIVEPSTVDHANTELSETLSVDQGGFFRALGRGHDHRALHLVLPDFMMDELRWVADQEGCDMQDLVLNAVDEFLADHWVRNTEG